MDGALFLAEKQLLVAEVSERVACFGGAGIGLGFQIFLVLLFLIVEERTRRAYNTGEASEEGAGWVTCLYK
jgi:hypothetical protein